MDIKSLKVPPRLAHFATLPCETLMSAKQATNTKLQGSVPTHLRCDGDVNNQIKKKFIAESASEKMFKIGE